MGAATAASCSTGASARTRSTRPTGKGLWIGRPVELPGSRPLRFEGGPDLGCTLREWPAEHCAKCLVFYHPDDPAELRAEQERQVLVLADACRRTGHDLLLEVIPGKSDAPVDERTLARALCRFYELGVYPDWWKLPHPGNDAAWAAIAAAIATHDPHCRGVLLLGLDAPERELVAAFAMARRHAVCKGFAIGRTIFGPAAEDWLAGRINDQQAIRTMAAGYRRLIAAWEASGMSELLLRHHAPDAGGLVHHVTPESAGWAYVGFELWRLRPGQDVARATGAREACLVIVGGKADITAGGQSWTGLGDRAGPFEGKGPCSVYVPWRGEFRVTATSDLELAICWAPGGGSYPVRLIAPEAVTYSSRGTGANVRHVRDILPESEPAHALLVVEVITPGGNWSSYPSHKHDVDDRPRNRCSRRPTTTGSTRRRASPSSASTPTIGRSTWRWRSRTAT